MRKIITRLPYKLQEVWRKRADFIMYEKCKDVYFSDIQDFVTVTAHELANPAFGNIKSSPYSKPISKSFASTTTTGSFSNKRICHLCNEDHFLNQCKTFRKLTLEERFKFVKENELCFACLNKGHLLKFCKRDKPCLKCDKKHTTLLHDDSKTMNETVSKSTVGFVDTRAEKMFLPIVPVKIRKPKTNEFIQAYALIDRGSQSSFCTEKLFNKLGVKGIPNKICTTTINSKEISYTNIIRDLTLMDLSDVNKWPYLNDLTIPEIDAEVDLILGCDVPDVHVYRRQLFSPDMKGPIASLTKLGWIISGFSGNSVPNSKLQSKAMCTKTCSSPICSICSEFLDIPGETKDTSVEHKEFIKHVDSSIQQNKTTNHHTESSPKQWNYVPTKLNPADDAARGLSADKFINSTRWQNGPEFLQTQSTSWPVQPVLSQVELPPKDMKTKSFNTTSTPSFFNDYCKRFSNWTTCKRVMAWMLIAVQKFKSLLKSNTSYTNPDTANYLTFTRVKAAELSILKGIQQEDFSNTITQLKTNGVVKRSSPLYKLSPLIQNELLCVGGRLNNSNLPSNVSHPIILSKKCELNRLIIDHCRLVVGHCGGNHVLSELRRKFWIINANSQTRKVLKNCVTCRKLQAPVLTQQMADLPSDRITPNQPAFSSVGIDLFGPYVLKRGRWELKRYGVIFTCLVIRAIHLEVVYSLDCDSFLMAIRRFIACRGSPKEIRTDNGTNFVAGNKELQQGIQQWNNSTLQDFVTQKEIVWKFNPPSGSHHGGAWERLIRSVRKVLAGVVASQPLTEESLPTFFCEVEYIINGRPLTTVSDDPKDMNTLTPNQLLLFRQDINFPRFVTSSTDQFSKKRWKQIQFLSDLFWKRWTKEYLLLLQQRQKWNEKVKNLQLNDIVLIVDENLPRNQSRYFLTTKD